MPKATRITDFKILRGITPCSRARIPVPRAPVMVATLLDEEAFKADQRLEHGRTLFLHDQMHDFAWLDGLLRYYPHKGDPEDVLLIYGTEEVEMPMRFDPMTGAPIAV